MRRGPNITTDRAVNLFEEALSVRRDYCADRDFFKASDYWRYVCDESDDWEIKTYRKEGIEEFTRKAGVIAFGGKVTLISDEDLLRNADRGCLFSNFVLAHELGHLIADHHSSSRSVKNFSIYEGPNGKTTRPTNVEEAEAHLAAIFLQCGSNLLDYEGDPFSLAKRSFTDPSQVRRALRFTNLDVFKRILFRRKPAYPRVIF